MGPIEVVAYQPPDRVLLMIGASFRSEPLIEAARRLGPIVRADIEKLGTLAVAEDAGDKLESMARGIEGMLTDPVLKKGDTPLQMAEVGALMARIRAYLVELRSRALINLSLDEPTIRRVHSAAPEVADGYARDLLEELLERVSAAQAAMPRLEDVGINRRFIDRGKRLANQMKTAIGVQDLDPKNLKLKTRRLYTRKAALYRLEKHVVRAGRFAFATAPKRRRLYHLREIEPKT